MEDLNRHERLLAIEKENLQLKKRNAELTDFIENGTVPLHWVNDEGIITWANQAELDLLGYNKDEYVGLPIQDFHVDHDVIREILTRLLNNETLRDFPARLKCKDGAIKYVHISSNALMVDGKFIRSRCFTKDVTQFVHQEQRRIEEEGRKNKLLSLLRKSEERLRMAIIATDLGNWDWELATEKIYFSSEAKRILGLTFVEKSIDSILQYVHIYDRSIVDEVIHNVTVNDHDYFNFSCRIIKPGDIAITWIEFKGVAYYEPEKKLSRILGSVLDITERKQAEEKNSQLVAIVNSSYDAIISKTLGGIVTTWNNAAEQLFGYAAEEMIDQPILKIIPEDRQHEEDYILQQLRSGETVSHFETIRKTKSGKLLEVSLTISPIRNGRGQIIGISKIARDITEKKQAERKRNDFVSMVSHELKTPLS